MTSTITRGAIRTACMPISLKPTSSGARGYQHRWFNLHGQVLGVQVATSTGDAQDQYNRAVFEESIVSSSCVGRTRPSLTKASSIKSPSPYAGCPWPAVEMTTTMGASGEIGDAHLLHKVSVVPSPTRSPIRNSSRPSP